MIKWIKDKILGRENDYKRLKKQVSDLERVAKIGSWSVDANGTVWWSDGMYEIYQMERNSNLDEWEKDFKERINPKDWQSFQASVNKALGGEGSLNVKARVLREVEVGYAYQWVHIVGESIVKDGVNVGIIGTTQLVNETERALKEVEQKEIFINRLISDIENENSRDKVLKILDDAKGI